ncbi:hypothetical protein [Prauserella halophila]|uniref:hypothetical protein n=1 Tax=Prauserella halophila TaxID=185641 RepID=UPI0020A445F5|nr:hypothetical protein [Prauserella halophila]MCP2235380.1 hypothetical protein [Prauserella halophila]
MIETWNGPRPEEERAGAAENEPSRAAEATFTTSVPRPADIAAYRRRRSCRRAEHHLRVAGLWGALSARVLADIEAGAS